MEFCNQKRIELDEIQTMVKYVNEKLLHIANTILNRPNYEYYLEFAVMIPFYNSEQSQSGFKLRIIRSEYSIKQIVCEYAFALHQKSTNEGTPTFVSQFCCIRTFDVIPRQGMCQTDSAGDSDSEESEFLTFKQRGWAEFLILIKHWIGSKLGLEMQETYIHPGTIKIFNKHHRDKPEQQITILAEDLPDSFLGVLIPPTKAMESYTENAIQKWLDRVTRYTKNYELLLTIPFEQRRNRRYRHLKKIPPPEHMAYTSHPNPYQVSLDTQK